MEDEPAGQARSRTVSEEEQLIQIHWKLLPFLDHMVETGIEGWRYLRKNGVGLKNAFGKNDLEIKHGHPDHMFTEQVKSTGIVINIAITWDVNESHFGISIRFSEDCNFFILIMLVGNILLHRRARCGIFKGLHDSLSELYPLLKLFLANCFHISMFSINIKSYLSIRINNKLAILVLNIKIFMKSYYQQCSASPSMMETRNFRFFSFCCLSPS